MTFNYNDVEGSETPQLSDAARANLQCNILYPSRSYYSKQLFVRFDSVEAFRAWLSKWPPSGETRPASPQVQQAAGDTVNLLFSAAGLSKLGVSSTKIAAMDSAYVRGAHDARTLSKLRDSAPAQWQAHETEWHAALLVHSNTDKPLQPPANSIYQLEQGNSLDANGRVVTDATAQYGRYNIFGYKDGISMTVYEGELTGSADYYEPRRKLSLLLARDVLAASPSAFGSYFVFRKYEQDVDRFETRIQEIVADIEARRVARNRGEAVVTLEGPFPVFEGLSGAALDAQVRAWVLGRSPSGDPVGRSAGNDFTLKDDRDGKKCPFHAHTGKMNPRGRSGDEDAERAASIARRGISYGDRDAAEKGILFWCAQACIGKQFEYLLEKNANDKGVDIELDPLPDIDSLVGRPDTARFEDPLVVDPYPADARYKRWKSTIDVDFSMWDAITLRGSEYFFAPSLEGVKRLTNGEVTL